jgi:hypothetical protein
LRSCFLTPLSAVHFYRVTSPRHNKPGDQLRQHCRYERTVSVVRWATSTEGKPIISCDNGKTWGNFEPPATDVVPHGSTVKAVYIDWEKKKD